MSLVNLAGLTLAEIIGDFQLKFFAREHQLGNLFGGLAGYSGVIFFLIKSLAKGNVKLKFVYQTSVNQPRQKTQAIIKDACTKAGIDLELKSVVAAVFFGSDAANPDTYQKFWADMQMFTTTMGTPDPGVFMEQFTTGELSQKANKWSSRNLARWSNAEFDAAHKASQTEFDAVKRAALFIKMNDLVVNDKHIIPLFARPRPFGVVNKMKPVFSAWDNTTWALGYWTREA